MGTSGKKRVALCAAAVKLPGEKEGLDRVASIASAFVDAGWEVELITSNFQHWQKKHRETWRKVYRSFPYKVVFLEESGYEKNIDLRRIKSHAGLAKNLEVYLDRHHLCYDLVYAIIPPNDWARVAAEFAERENVPFIVDVSDLWPEAMKMALNVPVISNILFSGFSRDAKRVYNKAAGAVGTSLEYATHYQKYKQGQEDLPYEVAYVGNDLALFDDGVKEHAGEIEKSDNEFWVVYAGTLGKSYDLKTLVKASCIAESQLGDDVTLRVKILGSGPDAEELEQLAKELVAPVDFEGYVEYSKMAAWLDKSDITVNSLVKDAPQSIVSKIGDYLASGHPMINTGLSPEFCEMVDEVGFGVNIAPEDENTLAAAIVELCRNGVARDEMGRVARKLAEEKFDRNNSYKRIPKFAEGLL